jgi:hypothetical protein
MKGETGRRRGWGRRRRWSKRRRSLRIRENERKHSFESVHSMLERIDDRAETVNLSVERVQNCRIDWDWGNWKRQR